MLVLLVEDCDSLGQALTLYLSSEGYEVKRVGTISEAIQFCQSEPLDVLVSDLMLPDGNGWDLMARLNGKRDFQAIAISGCGRPDEIERSREAGFSGHVTKPDGLLRLPELIRDVMRDRRG